MPCGRNEPADGGLSETTPRHVARQRPALASLAQSHGAQPSADAGSALRAKSSTPLASLLLISSSSYWHHRSPATANFIITSAVELFPHASLGQLAHPPQRHWILIHNRSILPQSKRWSLCWLGRPSNAGLASTREWIHTKELTTTSSIVSQACSPLACRLVRQSSWTASLHVSACSAKLDIIVCSRRNIARSGRPRAGCQHGVGAADAAVATA